MANQAHVTNLSAGSAVEHDVSDEMDEPFNTRQGVDPIDSATITGYGGSAASSVDLTSAGQLSDSEASSFSGGSGIGVTGDRSIVLGTALNDSDLLTINYPGPSERTAETDVTNP